MRTLYLDLSMGVAGDMFSAALLDLLPKEALQRMLLRLNEMGLPTLLVSAKEEEKCGLTGLQLQVNINGAEELPEEVEEHGHDQDHHHHGGRSLHEVLFIIESLQVSQNIKAKVKTMYEIIAKAEGLAHNKEVGEVHFHEVGMNDAIFDVCSAALLMDELKIDAVKASHVCVGKGKVKCAHGILDVPAPATRHILEDGGVPYYYSEEEIGELTTPTGAAIIRRFATEFLHPTEIAKEMEKLQSKIKAGEVLTGYGMGHKDFSEPNCVRAYLVES